MNNLNIDETIKYVKNIVNNIRCVLCDKPDGSRMRYSCGHAACNDCVTDVEDCQICLTPPQTSSLQPISDGPFTQRVKNSSVLLKACQDLFNTDVFNRKRLSEQLRIEKELFPECIQAPAKYKNKRKSSMGTFQNKENWCSTMFSGEHTSAFKENIMENSVSYVQQWLNNNNKDLLRKPFRDFDVNVQLENNPGLCNNINMIQNKKDAKGSISKSNRKRSHFKTTMKINPVGGKRKLINRPNWNIKDLNNSFIDDVLKDTEEKCDNDESGIFMDNDPIVIDDSQEIVIDKDKNAWLSVIEACKHDESQTTSAIKFLKCTNKQTSQISDVLPSKQIQTTKVPFYKKSYLTEICTYCNSTNNIPNKAVCQSKDIKITIDNDSFTTTIQILSNVKSSSKLNAINSVSVQTDCKTMQINHDVFVKDNDVNELRTFNEKDCSEDNKSKKAVLMGDTNSEDLFADEVKNIENKIDEVENKENGIRKCLVIEESDSDMDIERSGPLSIKVDVHRSCNQSEYGILGEIVNTQEHCTRPKRGPRGLTPTSTDSSEKENYNPNRIKKHGTKKKKYAKKLQYLNCVEKFY